jgi:phage protein D
MHRRLRRQGHAHHCREGRDGAPHQAEEESEEGRDREGLGTLHGRLGRKPEAQGLRAHARKVKRARKKFPAALAIGLTAPGQTAVTLKQSVKFG